MARAAGKARTDGGARALHDPVLDDEEAEEDALTVPPAPPTAPRPRRRRPRAEPPPPPRPSLLRRLKRFLLLGALALIALAVAVLVLFGTVNPPTTPYMLAESRRLGGVDQAWVPLGEIAPAMARSAVAAEDADFCNHWGLDLRAIRAAMTDGTGRGGSTISQQVAKNVFLWQERSWLRKALEAGITPAMEATWSKRRILEVYLNVAEFGEGVFGVQAAARQFFGVDATDLTDRQAALLAAALPAPKLRDPGAPTEEMSQRASRIMDGAATIARDGRAACFEDPGL